MSEAAHDESQETRERILTAALATFAERGFDGARTREIAERAGANLGLIKYYFDTKEALWKAAVDRAFEELGREFAELLPDGESRDERTRLEQIVRRFVRFAARRPEFMRLMNDEGKRDGARMRWLVERHVQPMYRALHQLVERAIEHGTIPAVPTASIHYVVVGACGLAFSQAPECLLLTGVDPRDEQFVEAHADAVVRLLLGPG
ncbi:MAG: TetR/AcrR family transcriptional regulator [Myxococcota bacterium]|nr:TetR/AcrR family transcriptional regulator [Myxococcota bacterium]